MMKLGLLLVVAVQARITPASAKPVGNSVVAQRLELAREKSGASPERRADDFKRLAALEERNGNGELATGAAKAHLDLVAAAELVAGLGGPRVFPEGRLVEAIDVAIKLGDRFNDPSLVMQALAWTDEVSKERRPALARALFRRPYRLHGLKLERVEKAFDRDPLWSAYVRHINHETDSQSNAAVAAFGDLGGQILARRLDAALAKGDFTRAQATASAILSTDPFCVRARVVFHLLADVFAKRVKLGADDIAHVLTPGRTSAGKLVAQAAQLDPLAHGARLALAHSLLQANLFEDARRSVATLIGSNKLTPDQRATAEALQALAQFEAGRDEVFLRWQKGAGALKSWSIARFVLADRAFRSQEGEPPSPAVLEALRLVFQGPLGPSNHALQSQWASHAVFFGDAPIRNRALSALAELDPEAHVLVVDCQRAGGGDEVCRDRLADWRTLQGFAEEDESATIEALEKSSDVKSTWLTSVSVSKADAGRLLALLDRLPADRYGATPGFVTLRLRALLSAGKTTEATRYFNEFGAVLSRGERVGTRLVLGEVARGQLTPALAADSIGHFPAAASFDPRPRPQGEEEDPQEASAEEEENEDEPGVSPSVRLRWALFATPLRPKTVAWLKESWLRLDGVEGAELAGHMLRAAWAADDEKLSTRALARIRKLAPGGDVDAVFTAAQSLLGRQSTKDSKAAERLLLLRPTDETATNLFAETWLASEDSATLAPSKRAWIRRAAQALPGSSFSRLDLALEWQPELGIAKLQRVVRTHREPELALDWSPDFRPPSDSLDWWIRSRLATIPAERLEAFSRKVVAYFARAKEPAQVRYLRIWAHWLAGDAASARRVLETAGSFAPPSGGQFGEQPITPDNPLRLLVRLADPGEPAFRQRIYRLFERRHPSEQEDWPRLFSDRAKSSRPGDDRLWQATGCRAAWALKRSRQALSLCGRAWVTDPTNGTALVLSEAIAENPDDARVEGLDVEGFFRDVRHKIGAATAPEVFHNHSVWLGKAGRHAEAASVEASAWAAGYRVQGFGTPTEAWGLFRYQPLLARYSLASSTFASAQRNLLVATSALLTAELDLVRPYIAAVRDKELESLDPSQREWAATLLDVVELAQADLAERRLTVEALSDVGLALVRGKVEAGLPAAVQSHPNSYLLQSIQMETALPQGRITDRGTRAKTLADRFPANVMVGRLAMGALLLGQRLPEAELIFKRLIAARPNDKRLDVIRALAFGQKKAAARPDWVNTSRGWSDALSKASIQPLLDDREDAATLRSHDDDGLEVFLPTSFEPDPGQAFAFRRGGVVFMVRRVARVTRCEAPACLAEVTNALKTQNVSQLWGAPVVLPSGEGFEGIYEGPVGLVNLIVLPRGGHVYVLSVTGAPSELLAAAPIIRLFRQSFRSRDGSLAGPRAELVHRIAGFVPATLQLRARMLMAQPPRKGCPLTAVLAEATPAERPPLLVDAFLHTSAPVDRRRILSCTKASLPEATALGLAAVWDTDHEVMGFGRSALARHGARIIRLLGTEPALAMDPDSGEPHSPRVAAAGLLQVLLALPTADASRLSMRLLDSGQPKLRAGVLSALHWKPDLVPIVEQARLLREGSAEDAALLGSVLPERLETDERLVAIRARLDRVDAKSPPAEKEWALVVIGRLAARLDAADAVRLARLAEVLDRNETISTIATNHTLPVIVAAHRSGGRMPSTAEAPRDVQALVTGWRDLAQPRSKGVRRGAAAAKLAELPLNPGWSYFRVDHPGAFVAGFSDLGKRMAKAGDARVVTAQILIREFINRMGSMDFDEAGIDGDSPVECVVAGSMGRPKYACTGRMSDPSRTRAFLGTLPSPRTGAVLLPWLVGLPAHFLPTAAAFAPIALHDGSGNSTKAVAPSRVRALSGERLLAERVDDVIEIEGAELHRRTEAKIGKSSAIFDEALVAYEGSRIWLYSDEATTRLWRTASGSTERRSVRKPPERPGSNRPGLYATLSLDGLLGGTSSPVSMEVYVDSEGVHIQQSHPGNTSGVDGAGLLAALPAGAASHFVGPAMKGPPFWNFQSLKLDGDVEGTTGLPSWLWRDAGAVAWAWYPHEKQPVGRRWLSAIPWNAAAERAWKAKGWPVPSAQATRAADLWFQRRGAVVVLGPDRSLIEAPLVHKGANTGSAFEARLDVRAIQRALDEAAERGSQGPRRDSLKGLANVAALVTRVDTSAAIRGDEVVTKTTLRVPLSTAAAAPPLIDEWLRSKEIRNSFALPRPLTAEDVRRRIGFVVKSTRREDMQRAFPATPRLSLREEQGRFVLEVSPNGSLRSSPPSSNPVPERAVFVAAREIVGGEPSTAKKVNALVSWVHSQMSYELTSDQYDDLTLLTRKRGDCTEYAQLTVALLNAVDVPARTRTGFVAAGDRLVAHAWVEYHDGQSWTEIDPTMGRTRVDSSYIDASILDVLGLVGAGQLEITAIN